MVYKPHPELAKLYAVYTSDPNSIGTHLTQMLECAGASDPLLVSTGADVAIFPGKGRAPVVESFRRTTRGFFELAAISHLGTAVAWLARMREIDPTSDTWRSDARRLIEQMEIVQAVNTLEMWRDQIAVEAWAGLESKIVDLVDYSCKVTCEFLESAFADQTRLTSDVVRREYLDPRDSSEVPVPINDVMIATFSLTTLDIGYRITGWLRRQNLDWERLMVLVSGKTGRPTAGLTWSTNNMCQLISLAAEGRFPAERLYIAPHAPSFVFSESLGRDELRSLEEQFRAIWFSTRSNVEIAPLMFRGYPEFRRAEDASPVVGLNTKVVTELPRVQSPDDRFALVTRLRMVLEDPRQLVSNCVAGYMLDQLHAHGNRPSEVVIPGFSNVAYPLK